MCMIRLSALKRVLSRRRPSYEELVRVLYINPRRKGFVRESSSITYLHSMQSFIQINIPSTYLVPLITLHLSLFAILPCEVWRALFQVVTTRERVRSVGKERWVDLPIVKRPWVTLLTSLRVSVKDSHYRMILLYIFYS